MRSKKEKLKYNTEWNKNNREKRKMIEKRYRESHPEKVREWNRRHSKIFRKKLKLEVLTHYSGNPPKCACCEETEVEFLCLDHIDGGGQKQRRNLGYSGYAFYYWLKKNGFPEGFQVLCYNCNMSKGIGEFCIHERKVIKI